MGLAASGKVLFIYLSNMEILKVKMVDILQI